DFRDPADHVARVYCTRNAGPDAAGNEFNGRVHGYRRPRIPGRTRVYSGALSDYRDVDRKRSRASASRRDRGRHGVYRDISHMVHRYRNRRTTYGKCSSARLASRDWPARGHCSARDYELVFPQNLLGGWIRAHTRRRKALFGSSNGERSYLRRGLILLGFTSLYREGFEVVLFLQSYNLR